METLEPTESATATITGTPENPVLNLGIPQGEQGEVTLEDYYKAFPTDTASGSIASFPDGADNLPLKSLVVDINPVQDLHGQESPYPAGGGKNLFNIRAAQPFNNNVTLTFGADDSLTCKNENGYSVNALESIVLQLSAGTYTISAVSFPNKNIPIYASDDGVTWAWYANALSTSVKSKTVTIDKPYIRLNWGVDANETVTCPPIQIEEGSTATSYAPYENICPISGWEECKVIHTGKNLCDSDLVHGIWTIGGFYSHEGFATKYLTTSKPVLITVGTTCYVSFKDDPSNPVASASIGYVKNNTVVISPTWFNINRGVFTVPNEADGVVINLILTNGITNINETAVSNFQVELGSTATDYSPYTGRSITIDLGQTVYGGHLDVLSGELTVYPYFASYNGETLTGRWVSDRDVYAVGTTPTIGAQVVNIGAQGVTVQLEPHEVESLHGVNNLWADSGDTEVEYRADTKLYISKKIAEAISALS